ncbi:bifunctional metallophosphatase/5'-nucleotidase [Aquibacillus halophilus]|uniref:Bifunctional metallophosphatase/5'-nucleotidase n=1 Tax=Aquibacillus halophilus TaxID=930132 RepID=A0A6A8DHK2_9BACI|nr:bifunctional UDP-sugar hydrolase/5'-nucleotidase [Aquibacillus halophilus]MRH44710.1 bifunctional metallophosphatase/5'-nucleotidase [Aquibacillus halophilus]
MEEKIFFYYTSDIHSHFESWSKIVGYFNDKKKQRTKANQSYWLLDNGDYIDRFHPIAEATMGKTNVELLNKAEYHVATIGNNEGITLKYDDLYHLYDRADFELICANFETIKGTNPSWLKPFTTMESINGVKIGIIGLTAPFNAFYNLLGWHVDSPFDALDRYIKELEAETDVILLLSHLGINEDEAIARRYPQIDVIIGGHTHHLFRDGEYIDNTLLTAAGKHGKYVGEIILTWDHQNKRLVKKEAYTTNIEYLNKRDSITQQQLELHSERSSQLLNQPVVHLTKPLEVDWFKETELIRKLVETLKDWTNADCAMLNSGLLLESLEVGAVTYGDVHRICPHPINPCVVELKGDELLEVVRGSLTKAFMELQLKGFGFRGEIIGKMVFAGIEVKFTNNKKNDSQVKEITIDSHKIDMDKIYTVATADMFTFGKLLPEVSRSTYKKYFMPEMLRDLLVHTLKEKL